MSCAELEGLITKPCVMCRTSGVNNQGFIQDFFVGGGGLFRNSEIYIKHTFLGGSGGMPPRKFWTNHCPEIESGSFWQLRS